METETNSTTTGHTPLPWTVRQAYDNGEPSCLVIHSGADNVCDTVGPSIIAEANAALIVLAVNSFQDLREALQNTRDALISLLKDGHSPLMDKWAGEAIAEGYAALQKAGLPNAKSQGSEVGK